MDFSLPQPSDLLRRLESETGLLTRIRSSSEAKPDVFANYWQPLILAVARYVQECPFEQTSFSEPGGLLRYALLSAYYALQIGNQQFFTGKHGAEKRRLLVPQYRFAVFYSTLAGIPATMHARLIVRAGNQAWTPFHSTPALADWVRAQNATRFSIEWRLEQLKVSPQNAVAWAADIVGIGTWQCLAEEVAMVAHDAIYPLDPKTGESPVANCVRSAYRTARDFEARAMTGRYQPSSLPDGINPEVIQTFGEHLGASSAGANSQAVNPRHPAPVTNDAERTAATVTHAADGKVATPASPVQPEPQQNATAPAAYPDIVLDIFKAIRASDDYEKIKKSCNEVESGIAVPGTIFAKHGLPTSSVLQILEENKLIVEISSSRRSLILNKVARSLLFG